jgi:hypothetical protein
VGLDGVGLDGVDAVATDFVEAILEERFGLRLFVLVLKGFAVGARFIVVEVVSIA